MKRFLAIALALWSLSFPACTDNRIVDGTPEPTPPTVIEEPRVDPLTLFARTAPASMIGRIAYLGRVNNSVGSFHLFRTRPDGSNALVLNDQTDLVSYTGQSWSPDGQQLVVASNFKGNAEWDIYTINADGSGLAHLVAGPSSSDFAPAWSPDGTKVVFQSIATAATGFDIILFDLLTGEQVNLTNEVLDDELPSWSPSGDRILYQRSSTLGSNIWIMDLDGSNKVGLTTDTGMQNSAGVFSPDGTKIAFESTRHQGEQPSDSVGDFEIFVMDADGSNKKRLTVGVGADDQARFPSWSPDGSHIAFEFRDFTKNQFFPVSHIGVMNADGSNPFLLPNQPIEGIFPRWGP